MKLTIVFCVCLAFASGAYVPGKKSTDVKYADKDFLVKQKFIFEILRNVFDDLHYDEYLQYSKTYITDYSKYDNVDDVKKFMDYYKNFEFLKKGDIFTVMNKYHMEQVKYVYYLFFNCKDFDCFYKNVCWARVNINEGVFIYALTMAVIHRHDCEGIVLPAIYEIYPYYFVHSDVMYNVMYKKSKDDKFGLYEDRNQNYVLSNYTRDFKYYDDFRGDYDLSYFTEDVALNSWYYYLNMDYPYFIGNDKYNLYKDRRGELYLYQHQQLLARYYLERRFSGLGDIKTLDWEKKITYGYNPLLSYHNGLPMTPRMDHYYVRDFDHMTLEKVKDYEMRIRRAIDVGYIITHDGQYVNLRDPKAIDILGNIIQHNPDSLNTDFYRYIEVFSRLLLSHQKYYYNYHTYHKYVPGAMMHYETMLRDPIFYQLYQRIMHFYWQFKYTLPKYTVDELNFKGVQITDGTVDKIETYFEDYDVDVSNVMPMDTKDFSKTFDYKLMARQRRINHKPFKYTLNIQCDADKKGVLRVFMGAYLNEKYQLEDYKKYFVEVDKVVIDLKSGVNKISRSTLDFYYTIKDRTTYTDLYKRVMMAYNGQDKFPLDMSEAHCGFPDRLIFPRAHKDNMDMHFFFIISPYVDQGVQQYSTYDRVVSCGVGSGSRYHDGRAFGYPFDRKLDYNMFFDLKNKMVMKTTVRHLVDDKHYDY